jgi:DNA-binding transcriptional MerR regulator
MAAMAFTKKTPYLDTEDTLEEVGISRRQLNYWREKVLFTPEFGTDAKKFTEKDVKILKFARRLIVDQQFPVEVAKRLIDAVTSADSWWDGIDLEDFQYLDVKSGTLLSKESIESRLWAEFGATAKEWELEQRLHSLALILFRTIRTNRQTPAAYKERRDEIFRSLHSQDVSARLTWGQEPGEPQPHVHLDPSLDEAPTLYSEPPQLDDPAKWLIGAHQGLQKFEQAAEELNLPPKTWFGEWGRFYSSEAVEAATEAIKSPPSSSAGSIEEVPWDDGEPPF